MQAHEARTRAAGRSRGPEQGRGEGQAAPPGAVWRLDLLASFVAVASAGSFTAAAGRLYVTPSGLSRRIAALEASMGRRLFVRTTRRVRLSEHGVALLPVAEKLLAEAAAAAGLPEQRRPDQRPPR